MLLSADFIRSAGALYAGALGVDHPWVSPINGDLGALPRTEIYAGGCEILLPSIHAFTELTLATGGEVALVVGEGQQHTFPTAPVPEAREARTRITEFIRADGVDEHND